MELRRGFEILHTEPVGCNPSCEEFVGARSYVACTSDCILSQLIRVGPGATFALPAIKSHVISSEIPTSCVGGKLTERQTLMRCSRQVRLPANEFSVSAFALANPSNIEGCTGYDCTPDASGMCKTAIRCAYDIDPASIVRAEATVDFQTQTSVTVTFGPD